MGQKDSSEPAGPGSGAPSPGLRITIVSTHTIDRLPVEGQGVREVPGGPAFYVANALDRLGCPCEVITGPLATAHVLPGPQYVFPELEPIRMPPILPGSAAILSPVMREIDPASVPPCEGLLVVDLQGFVRRPGVPSGTGSYKVNLAPLLGRADVVKATDHELEFLDDGSRCELDGTLLVITRGPAGALVRRGGIEQAVPGREVRVDNTIGAGDTFLAAFVYWLVRGESPAGAATRAARFTEDFLLEKARDDRA